MLIHFAFGNLKDDSIKQANETIKKILQPRKLKVSKCKEFLPTFPTLGSYRINHTKAEITKSETHAQIAIKISKNNPLIPVKENEISYLPCEVPMICFIEIPFNKLKSSPHHLQYGQLGIAFTDSFSKRHKVTRIKYYSESSLYSDPIIKEWNNLQKKKYRTLQDTQKLNQLTEQIISFRKPEFLWENFQKAQSTVLTVSTDGKGNVQHKLSNYDAYSINYDFREEKECRVAFNKDCHPEHIEFEESDVLKIIVPNEQVRQLIESKLKDVYTKLPEIVVFPN